MKQYILGILISFLSISITAQVIPSQRTAKWDIAGLKDSIDYSIQTINALNVSADPTGNSDNQAIFQYVLNSLSTSGGGTLLLPPGHYRLQSPLDIPDNVRLKGSGADTTYLLLDFQGQNGINMHGTATNSSYCLQQYYTKGSDSLKLSSTGNLGTGDYVEIFQDNGSWDDKPASWAQQVTGMISQIVDIKNNVIYLSSPLSMDLTASLNPGLRKFNARKNSAVECLHISRQDSSEHTAHNISLSYAWNCRVVGVESAYSEGAHIRVSKSAHNSFFGNYLHHSYFYDGTGTHGYGIMFTHQASYNSAENNIFKHLRHAMMTKAGANTNVLAFNYSLDVYRSENPHNASGDLSLHGHYSFANLFEGNIVQNIAIDHYWGPSGPYNTFFRNRAEYYGIVMTNGNPTATDQLNIVGNEVSMNAGFLGQYIITGSNHYEYGNNIKGVNMPANTSNLTTNSLFYSGPPPYWNYNISWPAIGYPNILESNENPAKLRYESGGALSLCDCDTISSSGTGVEAYQQKNLEFYPNPASDVISLKTTKLQQARLHIYSISGKLLLNKPVQEQQRVDVSRLEAGIYLIKVFSENNVYQAKLLKI